jgi:hypothetical protein
MTITLSKPFILLISALVCWLIGKIIQSTSVDGKGTPFAILPMLGFYAVSVILFLCTLVAV